MGASVLDMYYPDPKKGAEVLARYNREKECRDKICEKLLEAQACIDLLLNNDGGEEPLRSLLEEVFADFFVDLDAKLCDFNSLAVAFVAPHHGRDYIRLDTLRTLFCEVTTARTTTSRV